VTVETNQATVTVDGHYTVRRNGSINGLKKVLYTVPLAKPFVGFAHYHFEMILYKTFFKVILW